MVSFIQSLLGKYQISDFNVLGTLQSTVNQAMRNMEIKVTHLMKTVISAWEREKWAGNRKSSHLHIVLYSMGKENNVATNSRFGCIGVYLVVCMFCVFEIHHKV